MGAFGNIFDSSLGSIGTNLNLSQNLEGAILTEDLASYFSFTENDYLQAA